MDRDREEEKEEVDLLLVYCRAAHIASMVPAVDKDGMVRDLCLLIDGETRRLRPAAEDGAR